MPGVVMVTLPVVLQSVGFPLEASAIIVAIDKFPDMFKTVLNVLGDSVDTAVSYTHLDVYKRQLQQCVPDTDCGH